MKKHINFVAVIAFVIALASIYAAVKVGHPVKGGGYGFSSGG
jgi:hypothetical protein